MTITEIEAKTNSRCVASQYSTLFRVVKNIPDSLSILTSERRAEQKMQVLLQLLKSERPNCGNSQANLED